MNPRTLELPLPTGSLLPPLPEILPSPETTDPDSVLHDLPARETAMAAETIARTTAARSMAPLHIRSLRAGCYLIRLTSHTNPLSVEDGTLRVETHHDGRTASGDLYQRRVLFLAPVPVLPPTSGTPPSFVRRAIARGPILVPGPRPADGIPVLPRDRYRHYLCVNTLLEGLTLGNSFTLGFDLYRFDHGAKTWTNEGPFTAQMTWTTAPAGFPSTRDYLEGDVKNAAGTVVGRLTMGWISSSLRRAVVEIDRVPASECPRDNGAGTDWKTIFQRVGWDVTVVESNANVTEVSGESWSDIECHQAMMAWRDSADLDAQWRYHLLCVRRLDSTERGIMFDAYGSDANNIPREGAAIASHWTFPDTEPWGKCRGERFGATTAPYFRTAVHELGHAMMQFHPWSTTGNHLMQVTPQIAENAVAPVQFPDDIEWAFSPEDARRLRHLPDVVVRPDSSLRFGSDVGSSYAGTPLSPADVTAELEGLEVSLTPLLDAVPFGAPVRVRVDVTNTGPQPLPIPSRLDFKSGIVTGQVVDPAGRVRPFSTIVRYMDGFETTLLMPGQRVSESLTLLRGPDGALFAAPGMHRIIVSLSWDGGGAMVHVSGETTVMVTAAADEAHAKAARLVMDTPDTLLAMVIGGDHLVDGIRAVQTALKNPVLRPHFAYFEAKRLARRSGSRRPSLHEAAELLGDDTVMSVTELARAAGWFRGEGGGSDRKSIATLLERKAKAQDANEDILRTIHAL